MKLALIIDDYLPNSTRVGAKMFHELAQEFIRRGHDVTVITPDICLQDDVSFREGANKQVISSQADSLIKISRIWADF
ncbi:hypothetical protein NKU63_14510, partial [Enterobacter cloacae]|nr:hypothetical protein [Enterobacter cloacae]